MDPDGSRAFIACSPSNNVSVFSLKTLEVTGYIAAGNEPGGLAWPGQWQDSFQNTMFRWQAHSDEIVVQFTTESCRSFGFHFQPL